MTAFEYGVNSAVRVSEIGSWDSELGLPKKLGGIVLTHEGLPWNDVNQRALVRFLDGEERWVYDDQVEEVFGEPEEGSIQVTVPVEFALKSVLEADAVSPSHYQFPGGAEVRHISEWLTSNAAQALQYIARSSRIDGQNKGDATEDLRKAIRFLEFELERLDV